MSSPEIGHPIIIASHRRSGTHLLMDLLRKQFPACRVRLRPGETLHHTYFNLDRLAPGHNAPASPDDALRALGRAQRTLIKTHGPPTLDHATEGNAELVARIVQRSTILYTIRDVRAVLCSLHVYMQYFDERSRCSLSRFIRQQDDQGRCRPAAWAAHVGAWMDRDAVTPVKFERVLRETRRVLDELGGVLSMDPLYTEPLLPRPTRSRLHGWVARLLGRTESTNIVGRHRGLAPPKWPEAFDTDDRAFIHEHAGEMLIRLGYEDSDAWVDRPKPAAPTQ